MANSYRRNLQKSSRVIGLIYKLQYNILLQKIIISLYNIPILPQINNCIIGYEPAGLTVHPPPPE